MKKKLRIILFLSLLACLLCVSANAEEAPVIVEQPCTGIIQNGDFPEAPQPGLRMYASAQSADAAFADVKAALKQGLLEMKASIDISQYRIPGETLRKIYPQVVNENPELFFVEGGCNYQSMGEIVYNVSPNYLWGEKAVNVLTEEQKSQIRQKQTALEQVISGVLAQVDPAWSDLEKALFLHDYLATHAQYDETLQFRDAYTILVEGTGVCQAYTLAYRLLLNRVNITSGTVTSTSLNHIWNILLIDGNWYHVDVTWDDPIEDRLGRVRHAYFCLSEDKLKDTNNGAHNAPDFKYSLNVKTDDKTFDNYYWANVDSAFVPLNGAWYYLAYQNGIMRTEAPEQQGKLEKWIDARWYVWGSSNSWWPGLYSGLSLYNDALIYNTTDTVFRYDPKTGTEQEVYSLTDAERAEGYIYGTAVVGNELRYVVQQTPNVDEPAPVRIHKLDPYTAVTAGGYSYYLDGKTLHLKRDGAQSGSVIAAWYATDGQLLGMRFLNEEELTANVSGAKTVKIFAAAQTGYRPLCEAILCTVE